MSCHKTVTNLKEAFDLFLETEDWNVFYAHLIDFFAKPYTRKNEFWLNPVLGGGSEENLVTSVAHEAIVIINEANLLERYAKKEITNPYGYLKRAFSSRYTSKKWFEMRKRVGKILRSNLEIFSKFSVRNDAGAEEPKYYLKGRRSDHESGTGALDRKQIANPFKNPNYKKDHEIVEFIIEAMEQENRPLSATELTNYLNKKGLLSIDILKEANSLEDRFKPDGPVGNPSKDPGSICYHLDESELDATHLRGECHRFISQLDKRYKRSLYFITLAGERKSDDKSEDLFKRAAELMNGEVTAQTIRNHLNRIEEEFIKEISPDIEDDVEAKKRALVLLLEEAKATLSGLFEVNTEE